MRPLSALSTAKLFRTAFQRRCISDQRAFAPGDLVILRQKQDRSAPPILTKPLKHGGRIESHRGTIFHDDIIGKRVRDLVKSNTTRSSRASTEYRLHGVTLEEYARLSRRLVTPIYPADASIIVNLLDLHPDVEESGSSSHELEILEAGTGHGALTLYLSRAIHGLNSHVQIASEEDNEGWKLQRRAVIHTIDVSAQFSAHAQSVVQGFRRGIYARNVNFHVGDVSKVLHTLRQSRGSGPFLSHAILDLPSADAHLATVAEALRTDGTLIVFNPSITQITECAIKVKESGIPLDVETILELGVSGGSGGREWDMRFVTPRAEAPRPEPASVEAGSDPEADVESEEVSSELREPIAAAGSGSTWKMVCRPRVGKLIVGGGFLGVFKKQRDMRAASKSTQVSASTGLPLEHEEQQ